jgi:hypothetical protein
MKSSFLSWIIALNLFYPAVNAIIFELLPASKIIIAGIETTIFSIFFLAVIICLALSLTLREIFLVFLKKKINTLISLIIFIYLLFVSLQMLNFKFNVSDKNFFELGYKYFVYISYCLSSLILSIKFGNLFLTRLVNSNFFFFFLTVILTLIYIKAGDDRNEIFQRFYLDRLDPNSMIVFCGMISLYLVSRIDYLMNTKSYYQIILNFFFLILSYYLIFKTNSVGILFSLIFITVFLIILLLQRNILKIFFLLIFFFMFYQNYEGFLDRLNNLLFDSSSTLHERILFYSHALSFDNLLNGFLVGTNISFLNINSFHNLVLELYYSGGFFLLVLFTFTLLKILISFLKIIKLNNLIMDKFLLSILLFNFMNLFIGGIFSITVIFWSLLGIVISRLCAFRNKNFMDISKLRM